jgi:hypothetical protein
MRNLTLVSAFALFGLAASLILPWLSSAPDVSLSSMAFDELPLGAPMPTGAAPDTF